MNRMIVALLAVASTTLAAQQPPPVPEVSYDEAVGCAFLSLAWGMRDEQPKEVSRAAMALGVRYMEYAGMLSGKDTGAVTSDMGQAGDEMVKRFQASKTPVSDMRAAYNSCAERSSLF